MSDIFKFINENWDNCVNYNPKDIDDLIGIPYPYTIPSNGGDDSLRQLYYWDTYFTNRGLLLIGKALLAKNNVDNMLFLVDKYGFMPASSRTYHLTHSQAPYLALMIRDIYDYFKDPVWLRTAFEILKKDYKWWMTERNTPIGLNQYATKILSPEDREAKYKCVCDRVQAIYTEIEDKDRVVYCMGSDGESGWDFTPRLVAHQPESVWVDLNSLLFIWEKEMAFFSNELNTGEAELYESAAIERVKKMRKYMWNGNCFIDYDFVSKEHTPILSSACFFPLFAGLANQSEALSIRNKVLELEFDFGISTCEKNDVIGNYQWDYPNGWPCQQFIAVLGLDRYGFKDDAVRIARNYINMMEKQFEITGNLWEKYNVVTGDLNCSAEYELPPMMGWSAGTYLELKKYLGEL